MFEPIVYLTRDRKWLLLQRSPASPPALFPSCRGCLDPKASVQCFSSGSSLALLTLPLSHVTSSPKTPPFLLWLFLFSTSNPFVKDSCGAPELGGGQLWNTWIGCGMAVRQEKELSVTQLQHFFFSAFPPCSLKTVDRAVPGLT